MARLARSAVIWVQLALGVVAAGATVAAAWYARDAARFGRSAAEAAKRTVELSEQTLALKAHGYAKDGPERDLAARYVTLLPTMDAELTKAIEAGFDELNGALEQRDWDSAIGLCSRLLDDLGEAVRQTERGPGGMADRRVLLAAATYVRDRGEDAARFAIQELESEKKALWEPEKEALRKALRRVFRSGA